MWGFVLFCFLNQPDVQTLGTFVFQSEDHIVPAFMLQHKSNFTFHVPSMTKVFRKGTKLRKEVCGGMLVFEVDTRLRNITYCRWQNRLLLFCDNLTTPVRIQGLPDFLILILCLLCFSSSTTWHQHNEHHTPWTQLFGVWSLSSDLQQLHHLNAVRSIQGDPNHNDSAHLSGEKSIKNSKQAQVWRQVIHVWNLMDPSSSSIWPDQETFQIRSVRAALRAVL